MPERRCQMCGVVFPEGTAPTRKYCFDCLEIRHEQARIRHREKERLKARERAAEAKKNRQKTTNPKTDRAYCGKCIYHGFIRDGLMTCDYILLTGHRRGCKAGAGCDKRALDGQKTGGAENKRDQNNVKRSAAVSQ